MHLELVEALLRPQPYPLWECVASEEALHQRLGAFGPVTEIPGEEHVFPEASGLREQN